MYLTKMQALDKMIECSRNVVTCDVADKLLQPFGYTVTTLQLTPKKNKDRKRLNYSADDAELKTVAVFEIAESLAERITGQKVYSNMIGVGSYADDITIKSVDNIKELA